MSDTDPINLDNYNAAKAYALYCGEVMLMRPGTVRNHWKALRHLLMWAGETHFVQAHEIRPVFSVYLENVTSDATNHNGNLLGRDVYKKTLLYARHFLTWAKLHRPVTFGKIRPDWIDTLKPSKRVWPEHVRQEVTLEMVRKMLEKPAEELYTLRAQASAAFLFLSGCRGGAFVTLPCKAIDFEKLTVQQKPALGVRTKNRKSATTVLYNIPDLLAVCKQWDAYVRPEVGEDGFWFAKFGDRHNRKRITNPRRNDYDTQGAAALKTEIEFLFARAGLPYLSPHKFRHGHAAYGLKHSVDVADYKAVSQNLMHANLGITDSIYAILSADDMQARVHRIGQGASASSATIAQPQPAQVAQDVAAIVAETLKRMGIVVPQPLQPSPTAASPTPTVTTRKNGKPAQSTSTRKNGKPAAARPARGARPNAAGPRRDRPESHGTLPRGSSTEATKPASKKGGGQAAPHRR